MNENEISKVIVGSAIEQEERHETQRRYGPKTQRIRFLFPIWELDAFALSGAGRVTCRGHLREKAEGSLPLGCRGFIILTSKLERPECRLPFAS
jgi:hypothetical protein